MSPSSITAVVGSGSSGSITVTTPSGTATLAGFNFLPSDNATLAAISLSAGTLTPVFDASTLTYSASVSNGTTRVTLTPTLAQANATVKVNSGTASGALGLNVGSNTITTVVTAQDGSTTKTYTLTVIRENNAPTGIALSNAIINENIPKNSTVGVLSTTDPDVGDNFTYTLVAGTGDTDNASFNINGSDLEITNSPNFEVKNSYTIRIKTTDQGSLTYEAVFTITIKDINDAPRVSNSIANQVATENSAFSFQFAENTFVDADADDLLTYAAELTGGGSLPAWLSFNAGTRTFSGTPLPADLGTVGVDVIANDKNGGTVSTSFSIVVSAVLPIHLNTFNVRLQHDGSVLLSWDTFSELNNDRFEISRSSNGKDFVLTGSIKGSETSTQARQYSFVDKNPANGDNYYKLVQSDFNGKTTQLGIRTVKTDLTAQTEVSMSPNPSSSTVKVVFHPNEFTNAYLIDLTGKLIQKKTIDLSTTTLTFNVSHLTNAIYIIKLEGNGKSVSKQILKN